MKICVMVINRSFPAASFSPKISSIDVLRSSTIQCSEYKKKETDTSNKKYLKKYLILKNEEDFLETVDIHHSFLQRASISKYHGILPSCPYSRKLIDKPTGIRQEIFA